MGARVVTAGLLLALAIRAEGRDRAPDGAVEPLRVAAPAQDSVRYVARITDNNLIGLTVTNYGFFGNNFTSRSPSLEYPLGSEYEHMVRGGLWIGAKALCDTCTVQFHGVSTGAVDGSQGGASAAATEFAPAGNLILARSSLPNSPSYSPAAVSELDLVCEYSDIGVARFSGSTENHRPLEVLVHQETYSWSFADFAHILILHLTLKNLGAPIESLYVGLYGEFASGPKFGYSIWPPSSAGGGSLGSWYNKKWLQWDQSLKLLREHYCAAAPPSGCQFGIAPYWIGMKYLGCRPALPESLLTLAAWNWEPGASVRDQDVERYAILSARTIVDPGDATLQPPQGDPVELIAVGPFAYLAPDSTVSVDFAYVGGADVPAIQKHASFAQLAFDNDYIIPEPPPSPRLRVAARHEALDLYWDDSPESASDPTSTAPGGMDWQGYRVHLGESAHPDSLRLLAEFDKVDTTRFNTGLGAVAIAPTTFPGDPTVYRYRFTVTGLRDGFKYFAAVSSFDTGDTQVGPLDSGKTQNDVQAVPAPAPGEVAGGVRVFPNPYRVEARWDAGRLVRDHYLWFVNLPERCTIRIYTLAGDLVYKTDFDGLTYTGTNARGARAPSGFPPSVLSGGTFAWDLISDQNQAIASGLYLYSVEDKDSGRTDVGKFLVVKSDREGF